MHRPQRIRITARKTFATLVWALFALFTSTVMFSALWDPHSGRLPSYGPRDAVAPVTSQIAGQVVSVLVSAGSTVRPGQILILLESQELTAALELARAQSLAADNALAQAQGQGFPEDIAFRTKEADRAHDNLRDTLQRVLAQRIRADFAGTVETISVRPGDQVTAGQPLLAIVRD